MSVEIILLLCVADTVALGFTLLWLPSLILVEFYCSAGFSLTAFLLNDTLLQHKNVVL